MSKRIQYADEQEVRSIFDDFRVDRADAPVGHFVPVNVETLVEQIVVSPRAPDWFLDVVIALCQSFGSHFPVTKSVLATPPWRKLSLD